MNTVSRRRLPRASMFAILALACACTDGPVAPNLAPEPRFLSAEYECRIDLKADTIECGLPSWEGAPGGPRPDLLLYASGARVVNMGGTIYRDGENADTATFNLAVLNLLPQPIGTTDGITANADTRLVITSFVQTGANATVINADGTATFVDSVNSGGPYTFANKQYISYPGVLAPNDTSQTKPIRITYNPTVTMIQFKYRISAPVQYHYGTIVISPAELVLGAGQMTTLSGTSFSAVGAPLGSEAITWSSSDESVATVSSSGVVTGVSGGTAIISATSMVDERRMGTRSVTVIQANIDAFPETISGPINSAHIYPAFSVMANDAVDASTVIGFAGWNGTPGYSMQGGQISMATSGAGMGQFTYSPPSGFEGTDSVQYTIQSGSAVDTGKVSLTVEILQANDDTFPIMVVTDINTGNLSPVFSLTANDQTTASTTIVFEGWEGNSGFTKELGTITMISSGPGMGRFTYEPPAGFVGVDSLEYTIQSGSATSTAKLGFIVDMRPAVTSTTPASNATNVPAGANIVVTFNEPVSVSGGSFSLECDMNAQPFTLSGSGTRTVTLNPNSLLPPMGACEVKVLAAQVSDTDINGSSHPAADYVFSFRVASEFGGEP